jgi:N6-adenosine-specific RNA methylase IME4
LSIDEHLIGKVEVLVADVPWIYGNYRDSANGAVKANYRPLEISDICKIPVSKWLAKHAICLFWITWPHLAEANQVPILDAWGLKQRVSGAPWIKTLPKSADISTGIGTWFQSCSEALLIARKGKPCIKRFPILGLLNGEERQFYYPS